MELITLTYTVILLKDKNKKNKNSEMITSQKEWKEGCWSSRKKVILDRENLEEISINKMGDGGSEDKKTITEGKKQKFNE